VAKSSRQVGRVRAKRPPVATAISASKSESRARSLTRLVNAMSVPKRILTGLVALATAIGALWGAVQAVQGVASLIEDAQRRAHPSDLVRTQWLGIEIWQDDKRLGLSEYAPTTYNHSQATLDAAPFELRFPSQYSDLGLSIVAWTDSSVQVDRDQPAGSFDSDGNVSPTSPNAIFHWGNRFATIGRGTNTLVVSNAGHNFLNISNATSISGEMNSVYYSQFLDAGPGGEDKPMSQLEDKQLYLTVWVDLNKDDIVDWSEYDYIKLNF
jgi:hypothetical protein